MSKNAVTTETRLMVRCCEAMHEDGYCEAQPTCPDCGTALTFRPAGRYGPRRHGFAKKEALWCCPNQRSEGHPKPWLVGWLEWAPEIWSQKKGKAMQEIMDAIRAEYEKIGPSLRPPFERFLLNRMRQMAPRIYDSDYRYRMTDAERAAIVALLNA
jgi:hypothetical protein